MISTRAKMELFSFPFFTERQCHTMVSILMEHKEHWKERKGFFYTYGGSAYLDIPVEYEKDSSHNKEILRPFTSYIVQICQYFKGVVPAKASPPGFHIFGAESNDHRGLPHIDTPAFKLGLTDRYGVQDVFSFTIPIQIPANGAGMDFWEHLTPEEFTILREGGSVNSKIQRVGYQLGHMYIHSGLCPHRIASIGAIPDGDFRITLQGHGLIGEHNQVYLFF